MKVKQQQLGEGYSDMPGYFSWIKGGITQIQLDIVGFLAILGEGSVLSNAQVASLSDITYLPRLLPAPQALLRPNRPDKLDPFVGTTCAVRAGNCRSYVNHIGHVLAEAESYPPFSVRCIKIQRKHSKQLKASSKASAETEIKKDIIRESVTNKSYGPLWWVAVIGCAFSCLLFAVAVWQQDGMAVVANILLSLLSTLVGIVNKWKLDLPKRNVRNQWTPPGDVVIRYPKGNFLIVQCDEDVARELYFAPENIFYLIKDDWAYRMFALIGTIMLMFGVVCLANSQVYLQLGFAGAYILMNALYWVIAALPMRVHWDTSCFEVHDEAIVPEGADSLPPRKKHHYVSYNDTFTQALWHAIVVTKDTQWVRRSDAAPTHPAWDVWLDQALKKAKETKDRTLKSADGYVTVWDMPEWDSQEQLKECYAAEMKKDQVEGAV